VRLKVCQREYLSNIIRISIPFGAIKRRATKMEIYAVVKFQFLLVRLKEITMQISKKKSEISIPFGAIKS